MVTYRYYSFATVCLAAASALGAVLSYFHYAIAMPLSRALERIWDIAFPATAAVTAERVGLANDLILREPDRQRAKAFVSRMLQRSSNPHRSAPLAAGGLASAGLSFAC